ncbi:MAG: hypothetical protein KDD60_04040, partial [Bdellovibrionales bacterium]|nr:hypothetical protein [Bdellovibrionales bacterium]
LNSLWAVPFFGKAFGVIGVMLCLGIVLQIALIDFSLGHRGKDGVLRTKVQEFPEYQSAEAVLSFLGRASLTGSVAVESSSRMFEELGSPHYFVSELPRRFHYSTSPGLLLESSVSTPFLLSPMIGLGEAVNWSRNGLGPYPSVLHQPAASLISRLRHYRVEYVIGESEKMRRSMESVEDVHEVFSQGPFSVYGLGVPGEIVEETQYLPYLYIPRNGQDFRTFFEWAYQSEELLSIPILFSPDEYLDILKEDGRRLGGILLGYPPGSQVSDEELEFWRNFPISKLFLNATLKGERDEAREFVLSDLESVDAPQKLLEILQSVQGKAAYLPVSASVERNKITFRSREGVRIRLSYAPRWKAQSQRRVYVMFPSFMWMFGEGEEELRYDSSPALSKLLSSSMP